MTQEIVIPAQVRAGRALIGWSQEQLAQEADVGLSTVRDFESEKRAADTSAVNDLRRALLNGGVVFTHGSPEGGPGVRLVADRPNVIRAPTTLQMFEGMPFGVEWQGKTTTVFVTYSVLEDLGGFTRKLSEKDAIDTFNRYRGLILDAAAIAFDSPENFDSRNWLFVEQKHIDAVNSGPWYMVTTHSGELADVEANALMNKFAKVFYASGIPANVEVHRQGRRDGAHVFYFSPKAAKIAKGALDEFKAIPCTKKPDLKTARRIKI